MLSNLKKELREVRKAPQNMRSFGAMMAIAFSLVAAAGLYRHVGEDVGTWVWICAIFAVVFCLSALLVPQLLRPVYVAWMMLGHVLGLVVGSVLLTVLYYLLLTPIGIFSGARKKATWKPKKESKESYWITRKVQITPADMERLF